MRYRSETTSLILEELDLNEGALNEYGDFVCGSEYLESLADSPGDDTRGSKSIGENDICLMFSIDGAQLYESKKSDCWMFIWVIFELAPDKRYKKKHILPGGFIPGPNKPKDLDSFLFYSFHHLSALMKDGLRIWDALRDIEFMSYPFLIIASADGPGLAYLNGLNGHNGMYGCRLYCGLKGRLKPGSTRYYPALLKPDNYDVEGSNHPDASVHEVASHIPDSDHYYANLATLETSQNATQYKNNRKVTGISKPSILSGIPRKFDLPKCSGADLMHLISLNLTELLLLLWRGTMSCASTDDKATWDWCVLVGELWKTHGEQVAAAKSYLPGSFDRPPRNPAEKISSGYKAIEFLTYIYGLGPGIFYGVLPDKYWRNFCKLVYCVRRVHQHSITQEQLLEVNDMLKSFVTEFEELYYQRRADRLHFIRQSIHAVLHIPGEIPRMAMGLYYTQWSMERVIGDLGSEINQHSNPYANLSQRGVLRCQINALAAMVPNLVPESSSSDTVPESGEILGDGFILLRRKDRTARIFPGASGAAITAFFTEATSGQVHGNVAVTRWARLRLPTGQILRSAWKEDVLEPVRVSRISKAKINNAERIVEVKFYFRAKVQEETRAFALVSCFSEPDIRLLEASYKALYVCRYRGDDGLVVIDVKAMQSVVAMVPFHVLGSPHSGDGRLVAGQSYFLVEKLGLEMAHMAGFEETLADI
ncbi:hypothetical protein PsYK624_097510 [Phanerochaete sordida]|uniref:Uncharacterized protein n=1 Tax=Phanerochaete sordida TaxID=48140 RepID=A0A9P3GET8_9APHY|nr:hypothetical protein PsYK624_097510 [Phanerochaete sordida]